MYVLCYSKLGCFLHYSILTRVVEVGYRANGRDAALNKLKGDGKGMELGGQLMCNEDAGIQETI